MLLLYIMKLNFKRINSFVVSILVVVAVAVVASIVSTGRSGSQTIYAMFEKRAGVFYRV